MLANKTFESYLSQTSEIGFVDAITTDVAYVSGLPSAYPHELVMFETGDIGYILALRREYVEVLLFSKRPIRQGTKVARTKQFLTIPAGMHLLGATIDPFGMPLDPSIAWDTSAATRLPIDIPAPSIEKRKRISKTFETGVALVDLVLPLGKGQREMVIGDRKSGKTNFLLQTMLTQARAGTICIYVAVGKKQLSIKQVEEFVKVNEIASSCVIIGTTAQEPSGTIYIAPYAGMTLAEYFRDQGKDVLIVLDDMTTHARYYRQISLLIKQFPGRNSYPADIFYTHARLLERAGNFVFGDSERSITCLPVAETVQGDLSGYIQTNLVSITDGHLYFDNDLFTKGRRPAIHPFLSVTRVGKQTQSTLQQTINREIISFLTMYEKMQNFTHFGAEVSQTVTNTLATGTKVFAFFEQLAHRVLVLELQMLLFALLWIDSWHDKSIEQMKQDMVRISNLYHQDSAFREEVHALLAASESFNKLLGEVRGKDDAFYKKLGINTEGGAQSGQ